MFKRGDIVMYTPRKALRMQMWQHLEGSIGIVTEQTPQPWTNSKIPEGYCGARTYVSWIYVPVPGELQEPEWGTSMVGLLTKLEASNG